LFDFITGGGQRFRQGTGGNERVRMIELVHAPLRRNYDALSMIQPGIFASFPNIPQF
jgi:hypothetical protein